MKRGIRVWLVVFFIFCGVSGFTCAESDKPSKELLLLNMIAPGSIQIASGQNEGYLYLGGTVSSIAGMFLQGPMTPDGTVLNVAGDLLSAYGASAMNYSWYACMKDYRIIDNTNARESFSELLYAPFNPDNLQSPYLLPLVGIGALTSLYYLLPQKGMDKIGEWYSAKTVPFWGFDLNPWLGTGMYTLLNLVRMEGVAISEEVMFRGAVLGMYGEPATAISFGATHLGNILSYKNINRDAIVEVSLQTINACCIGFILSDRVKQNGGDLSEAVALHFWWNVVASTVNLLRYASKQDMPDTAPAEIKKDQVSLDIGTALDGRIRIAARLPL